MTPSSFGFELVAGGAEGPRRGRYTTPHGTIETPCFAPVGTRATVKAVLPRDLREAGASLILCNAFHLAGRPGAELIRKAGGLHAFMGWPGPILTDSGGYQVFSLAGRRRTDEEGVTFRHPADGREMRFEPVNTLEIQRELGADIAMVLDECPPGDAPPAETARAHRRTLRWAGQALERHLAWGGAGRGQALFAICQGGADRALREEAVRELGSMPFDGYALGGLSVGESRALRLGVLERALPLLPADRVRYLMGVGTPLDFVDAVARGADLFDCVTPTRHARNAQAFTGRGLVKLRNACHREAFTPLEEGCTCYTCRHFTRAYLRHLDRAGEILFPMLVSLHNLHFFLDLMARIRRAIEQGRFPALRAEIEARWGEG